MQVLRKIQDSKRLIALQNRISHFGIVCLVKKLEVNDNSG